MMVEPRFSFHAFLLVPIERKRRKKDGEKEKKER